MTTTNNIPKDERQPDLTAGAKRLRLRFVEQYIRDKDPIKACIRMGYQKNFLGQMSDMFMSCSFVLEEIEKVKNAPKVEPDLAAIKNRVEQELWITVANTEGTSKVAALRAIMELHKLGETKQEVNNGFSFQMILDKEALSERDSTSET